MKNIIRLDEEDLKNMVMEQYDVTPDQITIVHTQEVTGYGMGEKVEPVFYIEVEERR